MLKCVGYIYHDGGLHLFNQCVQKMRSEGEFYIGRLRRLVGHTLDLLDAIFSIIDAIVRRITAFKSRR